MKPIAAILTLPGMLDLRAAAPLKAELQSHASTPVDLDAANVERVGGLCAQVLIAAAAAWRSADLSFRVINASEAFREDLTRMGANDLVLGELTIVLKILTVDDSRVMRQMLKMTLSEAGYDVYQAADGVEGIEVLDEIGALDVIITDINMPRMDGFGFMHRVRELAAYKGTPILVLSTESGDDKKARARAAGASGWIVKPFNAEKLLGAVRRVTGKG